MKLDWDDSRRKQTHYFLTPDGYLMIVPGPFGQHRIIGSYVGECIDREPDLERFDVLLKDRAPKGLKIKKMIWSTSAPFYHQISHRGKQGNILLAGDAYHLFSPVGGVNMNVGISDAHNLASQLSNIYNQEASEDILDDYAIQRQHEIQEFKCKTKMFTELITQTKQHDVGEKFIPKFCNRLFIKQELPGLFSGYNQQELDVMANKGEKHVAI